MLWCSLKWQSNLIAMLILCGFQVNKYYDLATSFYEYGWGESFHFAQRLVMPIYLEVLLLPFHSQIIDWFHQTRVGLLNSIIYSIQAVPIDPLYLRRINVSSLSLCACVHTPMHACIGAEGRTFWWWREKECK